MSCHKCTDDRYGSVRGGGRWEIVGWASWAFKSSHSFFFWQSPSPNTSLHHSLTSYASLVVSVAETSVPSQWLESHLHSIQHHKTKCFSRWSILIAMSVSVSVLVSLSFRVLQHQCHGIGQIQVSYNPYSAHKKSVMTHNGQCQSIEALINNQQHTVTTKVQCVKYLMIKQHTAWRKVTVNQAQAVHIWQTTQDIISKTTCHCNTSAHKTNHMKIYLIMCACYCAILWANSKVQMPEMYHVLLNDLTCPCSSWLMHSGAMCSGAWRTLDQQKQQWLNNIVECYKLNNSIDKFKCCFYNVKHCIETMSNKVSSFRQSSWNKLNMFNLFLLCHEKLVRHYCQNWQRCCPKRQQCRNNIRLSR